MEMEQNCKQNLKKHWKNGNKPPQKNNNKEIDNKENAQKL